MTINIHPQAIVEDGVELGDGVSVGAFSVIKTPAKIGAGTEIRENVIIEGWATIGENCRIHPGAVIATEPQDLKFDDVPTYVHIGDRCTIRECVTVNRSTEENNATKVGNDCLLMAYVHIAHECILGNNIILANSVNLAGHVTLGDYVIIAGLVGVHQFVHIGCYSFIGGMSRVIKDILPYTIAASGASLVPKGLNIVGLRRKGFSNETISILKEFYKIFYRSNLNVSQAIERIKEEIQMIDEVKILLEFIENSKRGITPAKDTN